MFKRIIALNLLILFCSCAKNKVLDNSDTSFNIGADSTLDIITWNIENFPKQDNSTINYLEKLIDSMNVDVIALQEIGSDAYFFDLINKLEGWSGDKTSGTYGLAYL